MLKAEDITKLETALGIKAGDLTAKIASETEEALELPEGHFFNEEQLGKRDSGKYNEGKLAGEEIPTKKKKQELGYEYEGKTFEAFLEHHEGILKTKYSKGNNERVEELESDLKKQKETFEGEILTLTETNKTQLGKNRQQRVANQLLSIMPKETTIKKEAVLTLFNSEYSIDEEEGKIVVSKGGEKLKDPKTTDPLELSVVFNEFIEREGYAKAPSGRGGGNENGSGSGFKADTPEGFQEEWLKANPDSNLNSQKYTADYATHRKEQMKTA